MEHTFSQDSNKRKIQNTKYNIQMQIYLRCEHTGDISVHFLLLLLLLLLY